jgi:DDE superfamily endonuclease
MEVPQPHLRMNQLSAISNEGAVHFMTDAGAMNAALFVLFLGRLLRSTTGKIILIADRLKAHEDDAVEEWLAAHRDRLELVWLPRYAPELNPDEYLNQDVKGGVNAEGLPDNKGELRSRLQRFMRRLVHLPEKVRNYFQHPCVQYAAGT